MKNRWRALLFSALTTLVGLSWMMQRLWGGSLLAVMSLQVLGVILAAGFAFFAIVTNCQRRWPAGAALACVAPIGADLLHSLSPAIFTYFGVPGLVFYGGALATMVIAALILFREPPPPEPLARAHVRR